MSSIPSPAVLVAVGVQFSGRSPRHVPYTEPADPEVLADRATPLTADLVIMAPGTVTVGVRWGVPWYPFVRLGLPARDDHPPVPAKMSMGDCCGDGPNRLA